MSLDEAATRFADAEPNGASDLLLTALDYWEDGFIEDGTFAGYVRRVANDLREKVGGQDALHGVD